MVDTCFKGRTVAKNHLIGGLYGGWDMWTLPCYLALSIPSLQLGMWTQISLLLTLTFIRIPTWLLLSSLFRKLINSATIFEPTFLPQISTTYCHLSHSPANLSFQVYQRDSLSEWSRSLDLGRPSTYPVIKMDSHLDAPLTHPNQPYLLVVSHLLPPQQFIFMP